MKFYDDLFALTQRTHALMSHFALLCEDDSAPGDQFHQGGRLHAASLRDFQHVLRAEREAMATHLDALEHAVGRAIALMEGSGSPSEPHIYTSLCKVFDLFDPYLDRYPELSAAEAYERLLNNTLDRCYPVEKPSRSL